jgi:hypothetical protein
MFAHFFQFLDIIMARLMIEFTQFQPPANIT